MLSDAPRQQKVPGGTRSDEADGVTHPPREGDTGNAAGPHSGTENNCHVGSVRGRVIAGRHTATQRILRMASAASSGSRCTLSTLCNARMNAAFFACTLVRSRSGKLPGSYSGRYQG
jgi:hypothetical protein